LLLCLQRLQPVANLQEFVKNDFDKNYWILAWCSWLVSLFLLGWCSWSCR